MRMTECQRLKSLKQTTRGNRNSSDITPLFPCRAEMWLASPFQKTRFPWPALRKKSTCQHLKIGRSPVKTGLLASTESLRVRHPVPRPAGKGPRGARTAPRFASCSASLAKRVPSGSNNLPRHELPSGSATGALQGREDHAEPESRDWNGGDGPRGDQQERTRSLRTARSAHFPGRAVPVRSRAAGWGPRNPSPTPLTHCGHSTVGLDFSICAGEPEARPAEVTSAQRCHDGSFSRDARLHGGDRGPQPRDLGWCCPRESYSAF